ncbi:MAG: hypothetical protein SGARI_002630 [Bacillariaceae sp.]
MLVDRLTDINASKLSTVSDNDDGDLSLSSSSSSKSSISSSKSSKRRLKKFLAKRAFRKSSKESSNEGDSGGSMMKAFFRRMETIQSNIEIVKKATKTINKLREEVLTSVSIDREKKTSAKLQKLVMNTNKMIKVNIALLQQLKDDTTAMVKPKQTETEKQEIAVRKNVVAACSQQLKDEATLYRQAQEEYKHDIESKMKRQIKIADPTITNDALDSIMIASSGDDVDAFLQQKVLQNKAGANSEIQTAYHRVKTKCEDLFALETSVRQLHQMFLDLALLTELQGETLDKIEFHVQQGADTVEAANEDLAGAIEYQKKVRKKQAFLILIGAIVIVS